MPVFELLGARHGRFHRLFVAAGAEADEGADERAELHSLVLRQVARLNDLQLPADGPADEEQVDDADDAGLLQPLELGHDLARELRAVELEDEHLHGAEVRLGRAHDPDRSFRFCSSNSASVRMPCDFSSASF